MQRTNRVQTVLNDQEFDWLKTLAFRYGVSVSEWLRTTIREAAQRAQLADRLMAQADPEVLRAREEARAGRGMTRSELRAYLEGGEDEA